MEAKSSRTDGAVSSEKFFIGLLNIIREKHLVNFIDTNDISANYPGIDGYDSKTKTGLQITLESSSKKNDGTIKNILPIDENVEYKKNYLSNATREWWCLFKKKI